MVKTQNIDVDRLNEAIENSGLRSIFISNKLGITPQAFNAKRRGKIAFRQSEVYVMTDLLKLSNEESAKIFFP